MYDCEGVNSNDPKINRIYDKYVQEQMIRDLFLWEYSFDSFM